MGYFDDWHDIVRAIGFLLAVYTLAALLIRRQKGGRSWNTKTMDYWFGLTMWTVAGAIFTIQAILLDRPFTPGFVLMMTAIFVTAKAVHTKGIWGSNAS